MWEQPKINSISHNNNMNHTAHFFYVTMWKWSSLKFSWGCCNLSTWSGVPLRITCPACKSRWDNLCKDLDVIPVHDYPFLLSPPSPFRSQGLFWPRKSCLFPQPALLGWGLECPCQAAWTLGVCSKCTKAFQENITSPWSCFQNPGTAEDKGSSLIFFSL